MTAVKSCIILSTKGTGSSALLDLLVRGSDCRTIEWTRHHERETLYWTKAASVLGLDQLSLVDSEVPIPAEKARHDLEELLSRNGVTETIDVSSKAGVFAGWRALCRRFEPCFVEKSPHHLHQISNLQLIYEAMNALPDVEFRIIGLVRNPIATAYSQWTRWRAPPEVVQEEWAQAYRNLDAFRDRFGDAMLTVRYENLTDPHSDTVRLIGEHLGLDAKRLVGANRFHSRSVARWQSDKHFGLQPSESVAAIARDCGYTDDDHG